MKIESDEMKQMRIVDENYLRPIVNAIIEVNLFHFEKINEDDKHLTYLVGKVMKETHGSCDPRKVSELILSLVSSSK